MKKYSTLSLLFILFILFPTQSTPVLAQCIKGNIFDVDDSPLEFVNVALLSSDSIYLAGTVSDSKGFFMISNLKEQEYILKMSFIGYQDLYQNITPTCSLFLVRMQSSGINLDEVTVSADRKIYSMKNGNLIMTVQNTLMQSVGNAVDVLERLPSVVKDVDGDLTVIGKGVPLIYIDGRIVHDKEELQRLNSNDIKTVEFVETPGSQYDGEVNAVIKIITQKHSKNEGFSFRAQINSIKSNRFSNRERVDLNYKVNKFDFRFSLYNSNSRMRNKGFYETAIYGDTVWNMYNSSKGKFDYIYNNASTSISYSINDKHNLNLIYDYSKNKPKSLTNNDMNVFSDNKIYDVLHYNSVGREKGCDNRLNLSYIGSVHEKLNVDVNLDYFSKETSLNQVNDEVSNWGNRTVESYSKSKYNIYAGKLNLIYNPISALSITPGIDILYTKREGVFNNEQNILSATNTVITEKKNALYVDCSSRIKNVSITAGLRYEIHNNNQKDNSSDDSQTLVNKTYHTFFPNLSLTFPIREVQLSFSVSRKTRKPTYYQLREGTEYNSRFSYSKGNPLLIPSRITLVSVSGVWKNLYFSAGYNRIDEYIRKMFYNDENNSSIAISSPINDREYSYLNLSLNYRKKISIWSYQILLDYVMPKYQVEYLNSELNLNKSYLFARVYNDFEIRNGYVFSLNLSGNTSGNSGEGFLYEQFTTNLSVRKSFFNNKMDVLLSANDVFKSTKRKSSERIEFVYYKRNQYNDTRNLSLTITYKFNNFKTQRQKSLAGDDEINRTY